jgi:hypothetical protein
MLLCIGLSVAVTCVFTLNDRTVTDTKITRIVSTQIDYQSLLEDFDDYTLDVTDERITLEAEKTLSADLFDELDNLSVETPLIMEHRLSDITLNTTLKITLYI